MDLIADLSSQEELPAPLIVADPSEFQERINEFGLVEYWNDVTGDFSNAPVMGINQTHFDMVMSLFLMNITIETLAPSHSSKRWSNLTGTQPSSRSWITSVKTHASNGSKILARAVSS